MAISPDAAKRIAEARRALTFNEVLEIIEDCKKKEQRALTFNEALAMTESHRPRALTFYEALAIVQKKGYNEIKKYRAGQLRAPAGTSNGGRWISEGGAGNSIARPRNPAQGNPAAIGNRRFGAAYLNTRQKELDRRLQKRGDAITVRKHDVNARDMRALTAANGVEYAWFTLKGRRYVMRGDSESVPIGYEEARKLNAQGWRWSGHTHPESAFDLVASEGDRNVLKLFDQDRSAIYSIRNERSMVRKE